MTNPTFKVFFLLSESKRKSKKPAYWPPPLVYPNQWINDTFTLFTLQQLGKDSFFAQPAILYLTFTAYSEFIPFRALNFIQPLVMPKKYQLWPSTLSTINGGDLTTYGRKPRATTIYDSVTLRTYSSSFSIEKELCLSVKNLVWIEKWLRSSLLKPVRSSTAVEIPPSK